MRKLARKIGQAEVVGCRQVSRLVGKIKAANIGFPLAMARIRMTVVFVSINKERQFGRHDVCY